MSIDIQKNDSATEPEVQRVAVGLFSYLLNDDRHFNVIAVEDANNEYAKAKDAFFAMSDELYEQWGGEYLDASPAVIADRLTGEQKERMINICSQYASAMHQVYTTFFLIQQHEEEHQEEQRRKRLAK